MDQETADWLTRLERKIDRLYLAVQQLLLTEDIMAADLAALEAQVKSNTSAEQSAITLLTQLSDLLKASATDPARVNALADQLKMSAGSLSQAILANTPAQPQPGPAPAPAP